MATIQIRNVPDDVHKTYRRRAAAAGQSLQEYLLGNVISGARRLTPLELAEKIREQHRTQGEDGYSSVSATDLIRADRERRS